MHELVINLHMHTTYSDGHGSHKDIVDAALASGVDAVLVSDHNVWVNGPQDYYQNGDRKVLLLVGEEIHDQARQPQKSHLLVFGAEKELATLAYDPQRLLDEVNRCGGLAFIAHPIDPAAPAVGEADISWEDWDLHGLTGLELWNGMSEFKSRLKSKLHALYYIFQPQKIAQGPFPETLQKWDEQLAAGNRTVAIGGSDAHQVPIRLGPITRKVFPYEFHFSAINTHVFVDRPLSGEVDEDRREIYKSLARGKCFIGYDLPAPTRGFRFTAHGKEQKVTMGDEISAAYGITFQVRLPQKTECRLIKDGETIRSWQNRESCVHITTEPGVYRVEAYIDFQGRQRGWIFSNPIFVTK